jgi:hypothetical protein
VRAHSRICRYIYIVINHFLISDIHPVPRIFATQYTGIDTYLSSYSKRTCAIWIGLGSNYTDQVSDAFVFPHQESILPLLQIVAICSCELLTIASRKSSFGMIVTFLPTHQFILCLRFVTHVHIHLPTTFSVCDGSIAQASRLALNVCVPLQGVVFVDKHVQPSMDPCLGSLVAEYYGSLSPTNVSEYITAGLQTGASSSCLRYLLTPLCIPSFMPCALCRRLACRCV